MGKEREVFLWNFGGIMKNNLEKLNFEFAAQLQRDGYPVADIEIDIALRIPEQISPLRIVRNWTELPNQTIEAGFFRIDRDETLPTIRGSILRILKPWLITESNNNLPSIQVRQITRATGISEARIIEILDMYPQAFGINGSVVTTEVSNPDFPKNQKLDFNDCRKYGLSTKRLVKEARYKSRPPGGGPAQKIGIQASKIDGLVRNQAVAKTIILFSSNKEPQQRQVSKRNGDQPNLPDWILFQQLGAKGDEITNLLEAFYLTKNPSELLDLTPEKFKTLVKPDEIVRRLQQAKFTKIPLTLFVPWGVRPRGEIRLEANLLDRLESVKNLLNQRGIPSQILVMPADIYATEINQQVNPDQAMNYFDRISQMVLKVGFEVKPWSEIRAENIEMYIQRKAELTEEEIKRIVGPNILKKAFSSAERRSGYKQQTDIEKSAFAYLRERIIEGEIINDIYQPIKISAAAKYKDDNIDGPLPRIYIIPPNLMFPWLK